MTPMIKQSIKHLAFAATLSLTALAAMAQDYTVPANTPAYIKRGVEAADRSADHKAIDSARKPAETLMAAGLKEGDKIAEISSFGEYYSTIISAAIGPKGHLDMYDMPYMTRMKADENGKAFAATHPNSTYTMVDYSDMVFGKDLDGVYTILYYHDLPGVKVDTAKMNAKVLAALKPGGIYFIVDHKAADGSGWRDAGTIHRMEKDTIIKEVKAAGFELVTDSNILANPADDKTKMVFAAGTRRHTDQAVLVFRKPK